MQVHPDERRRPRRFTRWPVDERDNRAEEGIVVEPAEENAHRVAHARRIAGVGGVVGRDRRAGLGINDLELTATARRKPQGLSPRGEAGLWWL
jgi:hypothetical protein